MTVHNPDRNKKEVKTKKRVNPVDKGRRSEAKTKNWLIAKGFIVETTKRSSYRGQNDFFGLWDHIAVRKDDNDQIDDVAFVFEGETIYVQTKSNRPPSTNDRKKLSAFPAEHKYIFVWYDRIKTPRIIKL